MGHSAERLLRFVEPAIYGRRGRPLSALFLALATLFLFAQALQIRPDAGFDKSVPLEHPYMQVFKQYQASFGGANTVLVALIRKPGIPGDIYNEKFLGELKAATSEVYFLPGVDRSRVSSLFTPDVRFYEVVEGGFGGGANVVPVTYAPTPETIAQVKENVAKAGIIGRLVSTDQRGAMIFSELVEVDPASGRRLDYSRIAREFEDKVRRRFSSPERFEYRLKHDRPPFTEGELIAENFSEPGWALWFQTFTAVSGSGDSEQRAEIKGRDLRVIRSANPQYDPDLDIHIIGFAKVVGDVTDATLKVVGFFGLAVLGTMLALWWYLGSFRLALLPMGCSLVAVVWEFGLLHWFGYGLDPFAILVPFLVLAVSTSHGVQYVNTWADEVMRGTDACESSQITFRRLFIPGSIALATNVAGFLTLYQVPIGIIREMSVNACFGMLAVIITNKVMMPIWLSWLQLHDVQGFRTKRQNRLNAGDKLWVFLARVTDRPVAASLIAVSLLVLAVSGWKQGERIIGDTQIGVPELRPDSVYNRDSRAIAENFAIGVDVLKVIAEADANACIRYDVLDQIDRYAWHLQNTEGVSSTASVAQLVKTVNVAFSDNAIKFAVIPRNQNVMVLLNSKLTTQTGLLNWDCTAMPVYVFMADHKATTINRIIEKSEAFNTENAAEFFKRHPHVNATYCAEKSSARRANGLARDRLDRYTETRRSADPLETDPLYLELSSRAESATQAFKAYDRLCPVNFALATGNVGVMAATNEVVRDHELATVLWVYVVIAAFLLMAYRSLTAVLVICIPLFMVSIFANALMAWAGIGLKVATLPVISLAVGIGVDYGIYFYDVIQHQIREQGRNLREAYLETLRQTGKAVIFTGICLAGGVATWLWSDLQFQRDMGLLLMVMFSANMLGAVLLCPALCVFFMRVTERPTRPNSV